MTETLYIIGNGFDRYHDLDTKYQSFGFYLKSNYSEIYELLTQYFGLPDLITTKQESYYEPKWADFETALSYLDFESILDDNIDYVANPSDKDFEDSDFGAYEIQMQYIVENLTVKLCNAFRKFILDLYFPESFENKYLGFEMNSVFLNFNYTDTLERIYGINKSRILYIHGKAKNETNKIILGHGVNPNKFKKTNKVMPKGLTPEEQNSWKENESDNNSHSFELGKEELRTYFRQSFKATNDIIKQNLTFFNNINSIKKIFIIGHSLSKVDQPYFMQVLKSLTNESVVWNVTYYSENERISHLNELIQLGVKDTNINLIKIESLKPKLPELF